jgi:hypothetical protein
MNELENQKSCENCEDNVVCTESDNNLCEVCNEHTQVCEVCEIRHDDDEIYIVNDEVYCDDCVWNYYIICDGCNDWTDCDTYHYDEDNDERYCNDCKPKRLILNYGYKPTPIFFFQLGEEKKYFDTINDSRLVFGFELEVENHSEDYSRNELAKALNNQFGDFLYFKEDGSLNNGFEIVSHPMTYLYFKRHINEFKMMLTIIKEHGFRSYDYDTCGLHITLSRKAFKHSHFLKFVDFFNNSSNFQLLKAMSQRTPNSQGWARLSQDYDKRTMIDFAKNKGSGQNVERQRALNLQNSNTMEVRLFRGTLKVSSFFKAFESVFSIYDFTHKMTFSGLEITKPEMTEYSKNVRDEILKNAKLDGFVAPITKGLIKNNYYVSYVASRKKQFPNLNEFIKDVPSANYKIHSQQHKINQLNNLINNERVYI